MDDSHQDLRDEIAQLRADFTEQLSRLQTEVETLRAQQATPVRPVVPRPKAVRERRERQPMDWDRSIRIWLPRVFIVVLLLGVVFGFVAAVKAGYLTEPVRCVIGYMAAIALLYLGERQMKASREALGQVLMGGGIAILILSTFAANALYALLSSPMAFGMDVVFLTWGVYLSWRHRSEALAVVSSFGAVLLPFLTKSNHPSVLFLASYELICSVAFMYYALLRRYTVLYFSSWLLLHVAMIAFGAMNTETTIQQRYIVGIAIALQHVSLLSFYIAQEKVSRRAQFTLPSSFFVTLLWWAGPLQLSSALKWLFVASFLVYFLVALTQRKHMGRFVLALSLGSVALMLYLNEVLGGANETIAVLLEGTVSMFLGLYLKNRIQLAVGAFIYVIGLLMLLVHPLVSLMSAYAVAWLIVLASSSLIRRSMFVTKVINPQFWVETLLLLIFLTESTNVITTNLSTDIRHLSLSCVWIGYAVLLAIYGITRSRRQIRLAGILLLFVTLAKLIVVDIPSVSVFIRAILFIGLGGMGILVSRLLYRLDKRRGTERTPRG